MKLKQIPIMLFCYGLLLTSCNTPTSQPSWPAGENPFFNAYNTPFNVPPFEQIKNEHYMPAFEAGMKYQKEVIDYILKNSETPSFSNTIEVLEKSNDLLTRVAAVFFNLCEANTSDEMEKINTEISPILAKHSDDIYMNVALFAKVKAVYDNQANAKLNEEQTKLLTDTYKQFVRSGISLDEAKQTRLREINGELSSLTVQFGQNVLAEYNKFELLIDNKKDLSGLPSSAIIAAAQSAKDKGIEGKWRFTLHNPSALPFLQYADNRALREKMYKAYTNKCDNNDEIDNKAIASKIATLRVEKAQLLGYKNHAEYVLEEEMAKTPKAVNELLAQLWTPALIVAKREAIQMQALMNKTAKGQQLEAWDWQYYAEKVRKEKYNLDAEAVRPYFKLENVRDGIFTLCDKLYGIKFKEVTDIPRFHEELTAFEVTEANGSPVGLLYMDFHPRASKRSGAWMTAFREEEKVDGKRIPPVISITCNFTRATDDMPALLTADEVETFFHEFGHAIHGLFANTQYYSLSGTSVPRDFVELPSQIMENWAFEPEMLALYAKHYKTGEVLPIELVEKMEAASKFNQGFATVEYLGAAILDMSFHTQESTNAINTIELENKAMSDIGLIKQIAPRYRSTYFQHIFSGGYSSGYYSYIWAEVLDSDAYAAFKESGDIFNKTIAESFRKNILEPGGTVDPMVLYINFRSKEPDMKHLINKRGLNVVADSSAE